MVRPPTASIPNGMMSIGSRAPVATRAIQRRRKPARRQTRLSRRCGWRAAASCCLQQRTTNARPGGVVIAAARRSCAVASGSGESITKRRNGMSGVSGDTARTGAGATLLTVRSRRRFSTMARNGAANIGPPITPRTMEPSTTGSLAGPGSTSVNSATAYTELAMPPSSAVGAIQRTPASIATRLSPNAAQVSWTRTSSPAELRPRRPPWRSSGS